MENNPYLICQSWETFTATLKKKKAENCEKSHFIRSCLVWRSHSVCVIYSSSMPLGKKSNSIPIKLFSLVFGRLVIIWDWGGCRVACCGLAWMSTLGPMPEDSTPLVFVTSDISAYIACCHLPSWTVCLCFWVCGSSSLLIHLLMSMCKELRWTCILLPDHSYATSVNQSSSITNSEALHLNVNWTFATEAIFV